MKRSNDVRRPAVVLAVAAGLMMASAGCGSVAPSGPGTPPAAVAPAAGGQAGGAGGPAGEGSGTGDGPAAQTMPAAQTVHAGGASASTAAAGRCHSGALAARVSAVDAGAGQRNAALIFINKSKRTCWVYGFSGLIMIDARGDVLRTRTRRDAAKAHRVTLRPGAGAHALVHWTVVPTGRETRCPESARLIILPPDEVGTHLEIPFRAAPCDDGRIDLSPMAPGTRVLR
ncbi:DUF4232 domain-containing protein [Sphaerisporangium corydalis]|uniref:DUF4232 domain-containing protein n=1 Tax=Sphaerisporangium corydalis TaxID=1441875 RepID=A0ABV9E8Z7_9ACTN|nr:DUF4232 domain-containing protein [Sphaerisporangium corydalis]